MTLCVCIWFNFVEVAANEYSEMMEEARDNARLRNAYFEQVRSQTIYDVLHLLSYKYYYS